MSGGGGPGHGGVAVSRGSLSSQKWGCPGVSGDDCTIPWIKSAALPALNGRTVWYVSFISTELVFKCVESGNQLKMNHLAGGGVSPAAAAPESTKAGGAGLFLGPLHSSWSGSPGPTGAAIHRCSLPRESPTPTNPSFVSLHPTALTGEKIVLCPRFSASLRLLTNVSKKW